MIFLRKKVQIRDISKKKVQIRDISNKNTFDNNKTTTNFLLFIERTLLDAKKQKIAIYFRKKIALIFFVYKGFYTVRSKTFLRIQNGTG